MPRGGRLLASGPCSCHGSSEGKYKARRKDWEMAVLVSLHVFCGNCVRNGELLLGFGVGSPCRL